MLASRARVLRLRAELAFLGLTRYSPDQERDDRGRFGSGDGPVAGESTHVGAGRDITTDVIAHASEISVTHGDMHEIVSQRYDRDLAAIAARQGFDGPPRVVSSEELDRAIANGATEMYRGNQFSYNARDKTSVEAADLSEQFRSGTSPGEASTATGTTSVSTGSWPKATEVPRFNGMTTATPSATAAATKVVWSVPH
jgi:hypothetical protein